MISYGNVFIVTSQRWRFNFCASPVSTLRPCSQWPNASLAPKMLRSYWLGSIPFYYSQSQLHFKNSRCQTARDQSIISKCNHFLGHLQTRNDTTSTSGLLRHHTTDLERRLGHFHPPIDWKIELGHSSFSIVGRCKTLD